VARPRVHLAASLGLSALVWFRGRRALPALAPLVSGFLVDADHLVDYWLFRSRPARQRQIFLPAHGWEYVALLAIIESRWLGRWTGRSLTLGLLAHLLIDQATNSPRHPLTYSAIFRAASGFPGDIFGGESGDHSWRATPAWQLWRWL